MKRVMNYILLALVILFILVFAGVKWLNWSAKQPCPPPKKPNNVPIEAIWKGGCDGGFWIQLIEIKEQRFRYRVYHDYHGKLLLDADFALEDCDDFILTETNWVEYVSGYNGEFIGIKNLVEDKNWKCKLRPSFPAYGGEEWEIIKKKEEF